VYLEHALKCIDLTKGVFDEQRPKDKNGDSKWDYPKLHALSHYADFIRRWGALDGYNTDMMEAAHKFLLKAFYGMTNKGHLYQNQIARHNTRYTNLWAMSSVLGPFLGDTSSGNQMIPSTATSITRDPINLADVRWVSPIREERQRLFDLGFNPRTTTTVQDAERASGLVDFSAAVAVFVQFYRNKSLGLPIGDYELDKRLTNSDWVKNFPIQFHGSLTCWRRTGKNYRDTERLEPEFLRCAPKWRKKDSRKDYCWVQEYQIIDPGTTDTLTDSLNGRRVGQLQALVTVVDTGRKLANGKYQRYCGALIDVFSLRNRGKPDERHGMIELGPPRAWFQQGIRTLNGRRFYSLDSIWRSAHIIPASMESEPKPTDIYYINNYIDWDQYNSLYEDDWMRKQEERAEAIGRRIEGKRRAARKERAETKRKRAEEEDVERERAEEEEAAAIKEAGVSNKRRRGVLSGRIITGPVRGVRAELRGRGRERDV